MAKRSSYTAITIAEPSITLPAQASSGGADSGPPSLSAISTSLPACQQANEPQGDPRPANAGNYKPSPTPALLLEQFRHASEKAKNLYDTGNQSLRRCVGDVCRVVGHTASRFEPIVEATVHRQEESVLIGHRPQLVCYTMRGCPGCEEMTPVWSQLKSEGLTIKLADVYALPAWADSSFRPYQVPLTVLFNGEEFKCQWVGPVETEQLREAMLFWTDVLPREFGGVLDSPRSVYLDRAAMKSAELQAKLRLQGHHRWSSRRQVIVRESGFDRVEEICAESWPEQSDEDDERLWLEAFDNWRTSEGHWSVAGHRWMAYGRAKARGKNGVWYFCIIAATSNR